MNPTQPPDRPNILIIVMDAARASHFSCYGYRRETSPHVDRLAAQGVLYEQCISPASWTLPSMASLFTGLYPSQHGANFHHQYLEPQFATLAEVLRGQGYQTALFSTVEWVSGTFGMNRGFDYFTNYAGGIPWMRRFFKKTTKLEKVWRAGKWVLLGGRRGKKTYELWRDLRAWFARDYQPGRPFFAVAHFGDPHWPWLHHPQFSWVEPGRKPPRIFAPDGHKYIAGQLALSEADIAMMIDFYDGEISFLDHYLGRLFELLQKGGHLDNTLRIILADHGEELAEHGLMGHGLSVYENVLHVPLVLHHPDHFAGGQRVSEPVQNVDLLPTLLALLGLEPQTIPNHMLGGDLRPEALRARPRPFTISERLAPSLRRLSRVVPGFDTTPFNRYLRALRQRGPGYKLIWGSDGRHELYNLAHDPAETENLAQREPETRQLLQAQLDHWLASIEAAAWGQLEPELDEAMVERLRDLGYL